MAGTPTIYEGWRDLANGSVSLTPADEATRQRATGLITAASTLAWRFEAATWEEANAIQALRCGWRPYRPAGRPGPCPRCGATDYPEGSAQCRQCGPVRASAPAVAHVRPYRDLPPNVRRD